MILFRSSVLFPALLRLLRVWFNGIGTLMTTEEQDGVGDVEWLLDELKGYNRRPPWYTEPDPDHHGIIDPIFKHDDLVLAAYRATRRRALGASRFEGQASLRKKFENLNGASAEHKEAVVMKLSDIISPELRQYVETWAEKRSRKKKRSADVRGQFVSPPRTQSSETAASRASEPIHDTPNTPQLHRSHEMADNSGPMQTSICADASRQANDSEHSFSTTVAAKAKAILPDILYDVLEKSYSEEHETFFAHIGMSYDNSNNCRLILEIKSRNVESCAVMLFGHRLATKDGLRYITLGNTEVLPNPKATLRGCRIDAIEPYFGQLLDSAIRESPTYKEDTTALFSDYTRAVSLEISQNANDAGLLIVQTNLFTCVDIWDRLCSSE